MVSHNRTSIRNIAVNACRGLLPGSLAAGVPLSMPASAAPADSEHVHGGHAPAKLVQAVRDAARQYVDVNAAAAANYQPFFECVSGADDRGMGVHYINLGALGDAEIGEGRPEALTYEPSARGLQLVGDEYIVDAEMWTAHHNAPPMLEGHVFQFVNSPSRYRLPAFFELHVRAWRDNPNGAFVDWNRRVSCEGQ